MHPTNGERSKPPRTNRKTPGQRLAEKFHAAVINSQSTELVALTDLDTTLALEMRALVKPAIAAAQREKSDTRLLRLIVRYASSRNRLLASIHQHAKK